MDDELTGTEKSDTTQNEVDTSTVGPADEPIDGPVQKAKPQRDATRYGDWEKNGRCIDF